MIRIDIATLFPDMCESYLSESIVGRGRKAGHIDIHCHNIRDYAGNKHNRVDDKAYGGGTGMVMQAQPIYDCITAIKQKSDTSPRVIYMSPQGRVLPNSDAYSIESHYNGLLEHPQYTRPEIWHDRAVPAVLLTGAHDAVAKWQEETALEVTRRKRPDMLYDHRVNGEPYARYIRVFVPHKEREYDIVAFMKMIFHRRILTNREQKILKRMMPVLDSLPTPPECEENSRIWLNAKNAGRILDMYAPLFDMLREHGIDYRIEYSDTPDGKPVAENENFTVFA